MSGGTSSRWPAAAPALLARELSLDLRLLAADLGQVVRDLGDGDLAGLAARLERHRGVLTGLADEIEPMAVEGRSP